MKQSTDFPSGPESHSARSRVELQVFLRSLLHFTALVSGGIAIGWMCAIGCASKATLNVPLMGQAAAVIQRNYVDRPAIQRSSLTYGAIAGMVNALGDSNHSTFLTPEQVVELRNEQRGEFKGIGVEIGLKKGRVVVIAPLDQSPAQHAGVHAGDAIVKV